MIRSILLALACLAALPVLLQFRSKTSATEIAPAPAGLAPLAAPLSSPSSFAPGGSPVARDRQEPPYLTDAKQKAARGLFKEAFLALRPNLSAHAERGDTDQRVYRVPASAALRGQDQMRGEGDWGAQDTAGSRPLSTLPSFASSYDGGTCDVRISVHVLGD